MTWADFCSILKKIFQAFSLKVNIDMFVKNIKYFGVNLTFILTFLIKIRMCPHK